MTAGATPRTTRECFCARIENPTDHQLADLTAVFTAHKSNMELAVSRQVAQDVRALSHTPPSSRARPRCNDSRGS
ncbi:hypothetical protein [Austwickia sp. TVS 96-490-7B]|uniref:hypothetical protein n=1 Tax=Austwickia sp. TVS 96-490-7B TaxID=2830843 RepID=UPI001C5599A1|nr:hypothetical protein [Austwickia sp. TVS 96-490-7B]